MTDDDLEALLSGAFDARARSAVPDSAVAPAPRFAEPDARLSSELHPVPRRRGRLFAPLVAAAAVVVAVTVGTLTLRGGDDHPTASGHRTDATTTVTGATPTPAAPGAAAVHVKLLNSDGQTYGVGMPVIAYFSRAITDARSFQAATSVTVAGKPLQAAWYFEKSAADPKFPIEAHLRPRAYWPAHEAVHVTIASAGVTAGTGLGFDNSLSLDFTTGAKHIALVDDTTHTLTLTTDGAVVHKYPVSLGAADTPTDRGTKVIMEKGASVCMSGPGYQECGVRYTQRLTYSGEYLHAAPWNTANIGKRDTSNGCTNLTKADAKALYDTLRQGDIVTYPNATGPAMTLGAGFGDWNVSWGEWLTGGLVRTR